MEKAIMCQYLIRFTKDTESSIKYIFISFVLFCCSCTGIEEKINDNADEPFSEEIKEFQEVFPNLSKYNWKIYSGYKNEENTEWMLELDAVSADTAIVLALSKIIQSDGKNLSTTYSITRFIKRYEIEGDVYEIHMIGGQKLLYHFYYKEGSVNPRDRVFIKGKYKYLFDLGVLDSTQKDYYLKHKDSLDQVEGNDVPNFDF